MTELGPDALTEWIVQRVATLLDVPAAEVGTSTPFAELGLSSIAAVQLSGELEDRLSVPLSPTLAYDHPTVEEMVLHLTGSPAGT